MFVQILQVYAICIWILCFLATLALCHLYKMHLWSSHCLDKNSNVVMNYELIISLSVARFHQTRNGKK